MFIDRQGQGDRLVHLLIVKFDICGCNIPISIDNMLKNIVARDSEEYSVLILQLFQVRVFGGVYDLVLEGFIHCARILVDYMSFIMLKLGFYCRSVVAFIGTVGYTPGPGRFVHAVFMRVV